MGTHQVAAATCSTTINCCLLKYIKLLQHGTSEVEVLRAVLWRTNCIEEAVVTMACSTEKLPGVRINLSRGMASA